MRIPTPQLRTAKVALLIVAVAILILFAAILLLVATGFGFAAGDFIVNSKASADFKATMERAAYIAVSLFLAVEVGLA